jgi:hypothetical protein
MQEKRDEPERLMHSREIEMSLTAGLFEPADRRHHISRFWSNCSIQLSCFDFAALSLRIVGEPPSVV